MEIFFNETWLLYHDVNDYKLISSKVTNTELLVQIGTDHFKFEVINLIIIRPWQYID